jgi:DNA-binding beta-propeller fold protein YncE
MAGLLWGVTRTRRLIGAVTFVALAAIAIGVTGVQLPLPRSSNAGEAALPGVRVTSADLILRTGAGAPPGADLAFLAVEASGNLIVSDQAHNTVMRFDPTGHLISQWGPRLGQTTLGVPAGVAVQGDSIYVLDRGNPRVFRLDASGNALSAIDLGPFGTYGLNGLALDGAGDLYVADTGRNRILVLSPDGSLVRQIGHGGSDLGGFTQPMNMAFAPDGSLFVADWENARIELFDGALNATDAWTTGFRPFGVAVDQFGRVFAPDSERHTVEVYTPRGASLGELGGPGSPPIGVSARQLAFARPTQPLLYVLGGEGVVRVALENTSPPPQSAQDTDLLGLVILVLLVAVVVLAFVTRRARVRAASLRAFDGPVRLHSENGAQRQDQQPRADEHLLVAYQAEREQQAADQRDQPEHDAETRHHI